IPQRGIAIIAVTIIWLLIYWTIRWQLRRRRLAGIWSTCLVKVLRRWASSPPTKLELYKEEPGHTCSIHTGIDFFIPWGKARILPDEDFKGYPICVVEEFQESRTGAIGGEGLITLGSIVLYGLILARLAFY